MPNTSQGAHAHTHTHILSLSPILLVDFSFSQGITVSESTSLRTTCRLPVRCDRPLLAGMLLRRTEEEEIEEEEGYLRHEQLSRF